MNANNLCLSAGILLLLSACSSGPDFKAPKAPNAEAYISKNEAVPLPQRIALGKRIEAEWWTLFASEPLNGVVKLAVENNYDLAAAKATLAEAEDAVDAKNGRLSPQLSLDAAAGRQKYGVALFGPSNFAIPPFSYYEAGPSASWMPDIFGGEHRAVERQKALANYQARQLDAMFVAITGNTVSAALDMASVNAEIAAVHKIITEDTKTLELVQDSYDAGAVTKMDVLSAQNQLDLDRAMLPPIEQRASISRHVLSILVGNAPATWTPPNFELADFTLPDALPVSLPSELIKRRPDILAAEENLHAASAAIGVATANLYPQLTLTANMMQEALTPAGIFKSTNNAWSLAAGLTAPIFNGGTLTAQKREAEHAYQASLAQYQQTILVAFKEVADALTSIAHDDEQLAVLENALNTARSLSELSRVSYQAGAIGLLQVQDAERSEAKAQLELIRAQHQRYLDCVRLFVASGGSPLTQKS
jgi:NodT family efflux transporter outer membrane factor (OMF) lipoprotein